MRFPILPTPPVAPAQCTTCGRPTDPAGFVDLGIMIELHGALFICVTFCLTEMARMAGMALPDGGEERERAARTSAERALNSANAENAMLRQVGGQAILRLLQDVTLERLRIEMEAGGDADGDHPPGGGGAGVGPGPTGRLVDRPAAERDQPLPAASGRPRPRGARSRPREAAQPATGQDAGRGGTAAVDVAGAAATA